MASPGDLVQKGTEVVVGLGSLGDTNMIVEEVTRKPVVTSDVILNDTQAAATTVLLTNPGHEIRVTGIVLTDIFTALVVGASYTINSIKYRATDVDIRRSAKAMRVTIAGVKEDSMTYA